LFILEEGNFELHIEFFLVKWIELFFVEVFAIVFTMWINTVSLPVVRAKWCFEKILRLLGFVILYLIWIIIYFMKYWTSFLFYFFFILAFFARAATLLAGWLLQPCCGSLYYILGFVFCAYCQVRRIVVAIRIILIDILVCVFIHFNLKLITKQIKGRYYYN